MFERLRYNAYLSKVNVAYSEMCPGQRVLSMQMMGPRYDDYNNASYVCFKEGVEPRTLAMICRVALDTDKTVLHVIEAMNQAAA
jgi:hypothetical protein